MTGHSIHDAGNLTPVHRPPSPDGRPASVQVQDALTSVVDLPASQEKQIRDDAKNRDVDPDLAVEHVKDEVRHRDARSLRAQMAVEAFTAAGEPSIVKTSRGPLRLAAMSVETEDEETFVAVHLDPGQPGETHFRIFNPPYLVADPAGDIIMKRRTGQEVRFREDPLRALCEGIASVALGGGRP